MIGNGHTVNISKNVCTIMDRCNSKKSIARISMIGNRMFPLNMAHSKIHYQQANTQFILQVEEKDVNWLWHLRMGHLKFDSLNLLQKKGLFHGFPQMEKSRKVCEGCLISNQYRDAFLVCVTMRAQAPLEIVHTNLCGKMQTPSLHNGNYFLTFIDYFTRKTWIFLLIDFSQTLISLPSQWCS